MRSFITSITDSRVFANTQDRDVVVIAGTKRHWKLAMSHCAGGPGCGSRGSSDLRYLRAMRPLAAALRREAEALLARVLGASAVQALCLPVRVMPRPVVGC